MTEKMVIGQYVMLNGDVQPRDDWFPCVGTLEEFANLNVVVFGCPRAYVCVVFADGSQEVTWDSERDGTF
jgi:hypothetical protein